MDRAEMTALAAPRCRECERPCQRVEERWHQDEDGAWRLTATLVCPLGHRQLVEPVA